MSATPYTGFSQQFIAGQWRTGRSSGSVVNDLNPNNSNTLIAIPGTSVDDVDDAYAAAIAAQRSWALALPRERAEVMRRAADILKSRRDEIIDWTIAETGGIRKFAEIIWYFAWSITDAAASYPGRVRDEILLSDVPGQESRAYRKPLGVIIISPWNSPINLTQRALAPALALGNAVVLKPAGESPVTVGLMHAKIFEEAGLPPGLLNVVVGSSAEIGDDVVTHPASRLVSFTGSTRVGRECAVRDT